MVVSPYDKRILEILRMMIAPGGRMRISPAVEEAQLRTLWGESVDPRRRHESIREVLRRHHAEIASLARVHADYIGRGKERYSEQSYAQSEVRKAWLIHNFPVNVCKVQMALLKLLETGELKGDITVVDIGVGAGNAPVALFDFLIAWYYVCMLYDVEYPIKSIQYYGYDYIQRWLDMAHCVLSSFATVLNTRIQSAGADSHGTDILTRVVEWIDQCQLRQLDLCRGLPEVPSTPTLIIACNLLSELDNAGKNNLMHFMSFLPQDSSAILIEPGDEKRSPALFGWRREFMQRYQGWSILAPCGQEYGRDLPECCTTCWNLRRDSFHQTLLYKQFRELADRSHPDRRSWDEYENNLLSQSYTILVKKEYPIPHEHLRLRRQNQNNGKIVGKTRYIGQYRDFLKLCPASVNNCFALRIERRTGVVIPPIEHGDILDLECEPEFDRQRNEIILQMAKDSDEPVRLPDSAYPAVRLEFLPAYTERTRAAIDEIAYRLFGFQKMRDFQHQVLSRVLCGKSILAIAATGGGKSECFILPALLLSGVTIVVAPLKSLMQDQYDQRLTERYGFGDLATYINSDVPFHEREERLQRMAKGYYKIVYFTPEQLERDYVLTYLKKTHQSVGIRYIALDESHCISQWGHDFRPAYLNIVHRLYNAGIDPLPVRIALTATASPKVREDVCRELQLDPRPTVEGGDLYVHSSNRPELNFIVKVMKTTDEKVEDMIRQLRRLDPQRDAAIIFLPLTGGNPNERDFSQRGENFGRRSPKVTEFASFLERAIQQRVCLYHGKMEDENTAEPKAEETPDYQLQQADFGDLRGRTRRGEQEKFIKGETNIMVATKGFGMGIDKPNIRLVLHRTPPTNLEAYIQEAGRAGRDGDFANVVLYYSPDSPGEGDTTETSEKSRSDREIQEFFISEKYIREEDVRALSEFLKQVRCKLGSGIYFTNDEVIEFLDSRGFDWPKFPSREPLGYESQEHKAILDRGHEYQHKTFYIGKILSALYSFRPNGQALVERVQEVGLVVVSPSVLDPQSVIRSNAYFGRKLREAGVSAEELRQLVNRARENDTGIIPLAERLGCSLYETQALLQDIKKAESDEKRLIDFKAIVAPRWGAAKGKDRLEQWRSYAGAYRRATKQQAEERVAKRYGNEDSLRAEILRRLEQPMSEYARNIIGRALLQGESLYRIIGRQVRDYSQSSGERDYIFDLPNLGMKGKISRDLPEDAEVVYFRDAIQNKIQRRPDIARRYSELTRRQQYNEAQAMLIDCRLCSRFEAGFYTNPRIRIVAVHNSQSSPEIIVLTGLPGLQPALDDWFSWEECCKSKGWEVELGEVFSRSDEELWQAIDAFMREHNQRKQDDWNSYGYMLNDYIGGEREGRGNCLRAVMLGYLKTNEIVVGDNCYSCSRCVPDENFSQDLNLRKSAVQLLRQEIIESISEIEQQYVQSLPPKEIFQRLWELVVQEEQQARSVHPYLQGWSGRVLTDTPEHKSVHLLRLEAMYHGYWELRTEEFIGHLQRLLTTCTQDELLQIEYLFMHIRQRESENPKALELMAEFYRKQGLLTEELNELKLLVHKKPTYEVYERIIFISEQLRVSAADLEAYYIPCARLAPSDERALQLYGKTNVFADNNMVIAEVALLFDSRPQQTAKAMKLFARYLDIKLSWTSEELIQVGDFWAQSRQNYRIEGENQDRDICVRLTELFGKHIAILPEQGRNRMLYLAKNFGTHVILLRESLVSSDVEVQEFAFIEAVLSGTDELILSAMDHAGFRLAREALLYLAQKQYSFALEKALAHPAPALRRLACWLILRANPARVSEILAKLVNDTDAKVRRFACRLAVHYKEESTLQMFLKDSDEQIRRIAAKSLGVDVERGLRTRFGRLFSVFSKLRKRS